MGDVIGAAADRAFHVCIPNLAHERHVRCDGRVQRVWTAPRAIAHAADGRVDRTRGERHALSVDQHVVPPHRQSGDRYLEPFDRPVHIAHGPGRRAFFAHHVPGFERAAQFQLHPVVLDAPVEREAEFPVRPEPCRIEGEPVAVQIAKHVEEVGPHVVRQHELVVEQRRPAHHAVVVGLLPKARDQRADQQLLREAHLGVRRHLERAKFHQTQASGGTVGRVEFVDADLRAVRAAGDVDEQVAEDAVDEPGGNARRAARRHLGERDLELVERIEPRFVDARCLARRPDEQSREQIRKRGMVLPEADDALEQIGPAQKWAVGRRRRADDDVIAAAGSGVLAVELKFLRAQPRLTGLFVERRRDRDGLAPAARRLNVHLDDARIGRHLDHVDARVERRRIAFDVNRRPEIRGRAFDRTQQFEIIGCRFGRRHEHADTPVTRFDGNRRAHGTIDRDALLHETLPLPRRILRIGGEDVLRGRERIFGLDRAG